MTYRNELQSFDTTTLRKQANDCCLLLLLADYKMYTSGHGKVLVIKAPDPAQSLNLHPISDADAAIIATYDTWLRETERE